MTFRDLLGDAQLHREAYSAALRGALRIPGSKRRLARQIGITPEYLSYVLAPNGNRIPSPKVAERIANAVQVDGEQRQTLLEHMLLASERRLRAYYQLGAGLSRYPPDELLASVRLAHQESNFSSDPSRARIQYRVVREAGALLIRHLDPLAHPLEFAEMCLLMHDVECVTNQPVDALYHAKLAHSILAGVDPGDYAAQREQFDFLLLGVIRAEAIAYHNLKLDDEAYDRCVEAEQSGILQRDPDFYKPELYRDKLNALAGRTRFAISEAEWLFGQVQAICERRSGASGLLPLLMIARSLAEAYVRFGNLKKANRLLRAHLDYIDRIPNLGALHRVLFLETCASLRWHEGDRVEWEHFVNDALTIARDAGLTHQVSKITEDYGQELGLIGRDPGSGRSTK